MQKIMFKEQYNSDKLFRENLLQKQWLFLSVAGVSLTAILCDPYQGDSAADLEIALGLFDFNMPISNSISFICASLASSRLNHAVILKLPQI